VQAFSRAIFAFGSQAIDPPPILWMWQREPTQSSGVSRVLKEQRAAAHLKPRRYEVAAE